jgi:hypothetical protein
MFEWGELTCSYVSGTMDSGGEDTFKPIRDDIYRSNCNMHVHNIILGHKQYYGYIN